MDDEAPVELDLVQITPEHIRANGTLHSTPFAGLAELIDNAVDSTAKNVQIKDLYEYRDEDGQKKKCRHIVVIDDGAGMNKGEALKTIMVGYSLKRCDQMAIGQFGNGLKSGSMRVGGTMLMVTRKQREYTALMISLKYLDTVPDYKCYVPIITYNMNANKEMHPVHNIDEPKNKHKEALKLILQYSPFQTEQALQDFMITTLDYPTVYGSNGSTCISISDLKRLENNDYEMTLDNGDFVLANRQSQQEERTVPTLSKFLQTLYFSPQVVIRIENRQVRQMDVCHMFAAPRWTLLAPAGLKQFKERELDDIAKQIRKLTEQKLPLEQAKTVLQDRVTCSKTGGKETMELRKVLERKNCEIEGYRKQINKLTVAQKEASGGRDIKAYFGIDVWHRGKPRIMFYSNGRRICEHAMDVKKKEKFQQMMGVVCILNIPATLLHTRQNREHFEIPTEFECLVRKAKEAMVKYFQHIEKRFKDPKFWYDLSYEQSDAEDVPALQRPGISQKLFDLCGAWRQCGHCGVFRKVSWNEDAEMTLEPNLFRCKPDENQKCTPPPLTELNAWKISELTMKNEATVYGGDKPKPKPIRKPIGKVQVKREGRDRSRSAAPVRNGGRRTPGRLRTPSSASGSSRSPTPEPRPKRNLIAKRNFTVSPPRPKSSAKKGARTKNHRSAMGSSKRNAGRDVSPFIDDESSGAEDARGRKKGRKGGKGQERGRKRLISDHSSDLPSSAFESEDTDVLLNNPPPTSSKRERSRTMSRGNSSHTTQSGQQMVIPKREESPKRPAAPAAAKDHGWLPAETPNKGVPLFCSSKVQAVTKEELMEEEMQPLDDAASAAGAARGERRSGEASVSATAVADTPTRPPSMTASFDALRAQYEGARTSRNAAGEKRRHDSALLSELAGLKKRRSGEGREEGRDDEEEMRTPRGERGRSREDVRGSMGGGGMMEGTGRRWSMDDEWPMGGGSPDRRRDERETSVLSISEIYARQDWGEAGDLEQVEARAIERVARYHRDRVPVEPTLEESSLAARARERERVMRMDGGTKDDIASIKPTLQRNGGRPINTGPMQSEVPTTLIRTKLQELSKEDLIERHLHLQEKFQEVRARCDSATKLLDEVTSENDRKRREEGDKRGGPVETAAACAKCDEVVAERDAARAARDAVTAEHEAKHEAVQEGLLDLANMADDVQLVAAVRALAIVSDPAFELAKRASEKKEADKRARAAARRGGRGGF